LIDVGANHFTSIEPKETGHVHGFVEVITSAELLVLSILPHVPSDLPVPHIKEIAAPSVPT
jgi:hypothetical protein